MRFAHAQLPRCGFLAATTALVLAFPAALRADEPAATTLRFMTYNLRFASDDPPNAWPVRRPVAVEMLRQEAPDVFGTQEGLYRQLKDLSADLPDYTWIGLGRDGGSHGEFMAIFYRRERLEPLEFDHFWLSDTPDRIASTSWGNKNRRMVTWIRFRDQTSGNEFYCLNTHFDHEVEEARQKSATLVWQRIQELDTELPIVVLGDFNSPAGDSHAYATLVADDRLTDTWNSAREHGPLLATFHNYGGERPGGSRIDWILTRGPLECQETHIVTFQKDGQFPSDHFPVAATLCVKSPP